MPKQREIKQELIFKEEGQWGGLNAARRWLHENGYNEGSMCRYEPIAFVKGEYHLTQKWKNMSAAEKKLIDGILESYDWREGEVKIILYA